MRRIGEVGSRQLCSSCSEILLLRTNVTRGRLFDPNMCGDAIHLVWGRVHPLSPLRLLLINDQYDSGLKVVVERVQITRCIFWQPRRSWCHRPATMPMHHQAPKWWTLTHVLVIDYESMHPIVSLPCKPIDTCHPRIHSPLCQTIGFETRDSPNSTLLVTYITCPLTTQGCIHIYVSLYISFSAITPVCHLCILWLNQA